MVTREEIDAATKKVAWAACEVNDCKGTRKMPCIAHLAEARKFIRKALADFEQAK